MNSVVALVMASCMGIDVCKDTTSRLHGYGRVLLVVKSPVWNKNIVLMYRLFLTTYINRIIWG